MYEVILSPDASEAFRRADRVLAKKLSRCFAQLEAEPRKHNNAKALAGSLAGYWRYRVGDWRVIYRINDPARSVSVVAIAHRSEVYE